MTTILYILINSWVLLPPPEAVWKTTAENDSKMKCLRAPRSQRTLFLRPLKPNPMIRSPLYEYYKASHDKLMTTMLDLLLSTSWVLKFTTPEAGRRRLRMIKNIKCVRSIRSQRTLFLRALNPNPIPFIKASRDPHTNLANVRLVLEKNGFDERVKKKSCWHQRMSCMTKRLVTIPYMCVREEYGTNRCWAP